MQDSVCRTILLSRCDESGLMVRTHNKHSNRIHSLSGGVMTDQLSRLSRSGKAYLSENLLPT
jgi:hypothetical protein